MNIEDKMEMIDVTPTGYLSLNDECRRTNTLINLSKPNDGAKPYDHVMYNMTYTANEIDEAFDLKVVNLIDAMKPYWSLPDPYPGDPYGHNLFKQYFSDHHPVVFRLISGGDDD